MRRSSPLAEAHARDARRAVGWGAAVAIAIGVFELWSAAAAMKERNHLDAESTAVALDGVVVLALGVLGWRGRAMAFALLTGLALGGIVFQRSQGAPWAAAITNLVTAAFYARAWRWSRAIPPLAQKSSPASG